jgi:hypothetical protein
MANITRWVQQWQVPRSTGKKPDYKVSMDRDGNFACDCLFWINCKAPKADCRHILSIKLMLERTASVEERISEIQEGELQRIYGPPEDKFPEKKRFIRR